MSRIHVISASAGTGKTYRLSTYLQERLLDPDDPPRPEGVMAITYTRKAAAELRSRLRRRLLQQGRPDLAGRIRDGYVGTVHAVCQRLLSEHALQAGLSPELTPVPESEEARVFQGALEAVVEEAGSAALHDAAERLGLDAWHADVRALVEKARINGLGPDGVRASGARSLEGLLALLPSPVGDRAGRDRALLEAVETLVDDLEPHAGDSAAGRKRAERASSLMAALRGGRAGWGELIAVRKLVGIKLHADAAAPFLFEVNRHESHPGLREDLTTVVTGVAEAAAAVLERFAQDKRRARIVDYGDMLTGARALLDDPAVRADLAERLDLLLVDEFQDTSPIQLELITALTEAAGEAAWVGDRKQSIFGFQGADPELMDAAARAVLEGETPEVLAQSWRSRPGVVELSSELFAAALAPHGFDPAEVRITAVRPDPPELAGEPSLELWRGQGKVWPALAEGVRDLLARGTPVRGWRPDEPDAVRPVRPGDVAVLCRSNEHCKSVARALGEVGVPASVALPGLFTTPEGVLARAALAVLADPRDSLASAVVSWLTGGAGDDPDGWLAARLEAVATVVGEDEERPAPFADDPSVAALRAALAECPAVSPTEAFDVAIEAVALREVCLSWPDSDERLANLEAMRAAAREYESLCEARGGACTVAGLAAHLDGLPEDDETARRAAPSTADVVQVLTYHKAKGLEWPVTVLASLDAEPKLKPFGVVTEAAEEFDPASPLAGRWVRYWPWPYGGQKTGADLMTSALDSAPGRRVATRERRERVRVLYVGFTRARDLVVLYAKQGKGGVGAGWLDELAGEDEAPALQAPWDGDGAAVARVGDVEFPCTVREVAGGDPADPPPRVGAPALGPVRPSPTTRPTERIRPSAAEPIAGATVAETVDLGPPLAHSATDEDAASLGDAVHAFLAAPDSARTAAAAAAQLEAHGVAHAFTPAALLAAAQRLQAAIEARWPGGEALPEWPIRRRIAAPEGGRLLVGEIDLLVDHAGGVEVIDHKTTRNPHVDAYTGQLAEYRDALVAGGESRPVSVWLHFPLQGRLVRLALP